ncbi:hypothetical protein NDU88_000738, partial [Pleurodeles waltl]
RLVQLLESPVLFDARAQKSKVWASGASPRWAPGPLPNSTAAPGASSGLAVGSGALQTCVLGRCCAPHEFPSGHRRGFSTTYTS